MAQAPARLEGLVVASHGRHCVVESAGGERRICHPRGKKSQAVVGDRVLWFLCIYMAILQIWILLIRLLKNTT